MSADDGDPFDPPVALPRGRAGLALGLGAWALLIAVVPLYAVFLLGNLFDVVAILGAIRPGGWRSSGRRTP